MKENKFKIFIHLKVGNFKRVVTLKGWEHLLSEEQHWKQTFSKLFVSREKFLKESWKSKSWTFFVSFRLEMKPLDARPQSSTDQLMFGKNRELFYVAKLQSLHQSHLRQVNQ